MRSAQPYIVLSLALVLPLFLIAQPEIRELQAEDFSHNKVTVPLSNKDSGIVIFFLNASKCTRCCKEVGYVLNKLAGHCPAKFYLLIRVGENPLLRREQIDLLELDEQSLQNIRILFDIENRSSIGIEEPEKIKGNFGRYLIYQTPALMVIHKGQQGKQNIYRYQELFGPDGLLKKDIRLLL